jgi:hypothetical protein
MILTIKLVRLAQLVWRLTTDWTVWGSNPGGGEIFRTRPDRPWGPPSLLYNGYRLFPEGKAAEAWRWPPTPPSTEVENEWSYTSTLPLGPWWPVTEWPFDNQTMRIRIPQISNFQVYMTAILMFYVQTVNYQTIRNDQHHALIGQLLCSTYWLLHVSAVACHHQRAYLILLSYLKYKSDVWYII